MAESANQLAATPNAGSAEPPAPLPPEEEKELFRRFDSVTGRLRRAIAKAGRAEDSVALVAVSKWHHSSRLASLARYWQEQRRNGQLGGLATHGVIFAENYMQEAMEKQEAIAALERANGATLDIGWHFSGHLQSKKAKYAIGRFALLQTVDSLSLAQNLHKVLDQRVRETGSQLVQPVLIQVNIGEEAQKSGVSPEQTLAFIKTLQAFTTISITGLMCLPPFADNAEDSREYFVKLRQLRDKIEKDAGLKLPHLSMGMSHDFEVAVEEGATMVRVGTDIFGEREY